MSSKGDKKLHITHLLIMVTLISHTLLLRYERLKPYFQTSAQEISAILGYFPILKQQ